MFQKKKKKCSSHRLRHLRCWLWSQPFWHVRPCQVRHAQASVFLGNNRVRVTRRHVLLCAVHGTSSGTSVFPCLNCVSLEFPRLYPFFFLGRHTKLARRKGKQNKNTLFVCLPLQVYILRPWKRSKSLSLLLCALVGFLLFLRMRF